jgi:eukaryotic-like serine/threonine-protein kinase
MVSGQRAFVGDSAIETLSAILKHDPPLLSATHATISPPLASVIQHCLEYPQGKDIYTAKGAMYNVRLSPDGAYAALAEQEVAGGGAQWLTIVDRTGVVVCQSTKRGANATDGFAWTPDGREVWFTATDVPHRTLVYAISIDGRERVVQRAMGSVRILDIAPDGRALLVNDWFRADMNLVDMNAPGERDLTWRDWSIPRTLSNDGKILGFGSGGLSLTGKVLGYIRPTDGSAAVELSDAGDPKAISPDGKWVVTSAAGSTVMTLVPIGPGDAQPLDTGRVTGFSAMMGGTRWLADGKRIAYVGNETRRPRRIYLQNLAGGQPDAVTPEGVFGQFVVSPDSTMVVVSVGNENQVSRYPIGGGAPANVAGAVPGDQPLAWSPDGESIWVLNRNRGTPPAKIFRIELQNGRRSLWREVPFPDPAGTEFESLRVVMSADGSKFVYGYQTHLSELYVAEGLK